MVKAAEELDINDRNGTIYDMFRRNGKTVKDANKLVEWKEQQKNKINTAGGFLTLRRVVPIEVFDHFGGWTGMPKKDKEQLLWKAGIAYKTHPYVKDIGEYTMGGRVAFGWFIVGQERTDSKWINMRVGGCRVASHEAVMACKFHGK